MQRSFFVLVAVFVSMTSYAHYSITKLIYDDVSDTLRINVSYSGGCSEHKFILDLNASLIEWQKIPRYSYYLNQLAGDDDPCDAIINETLSFPMNEIQQRPAWVSVSSFADGSEPHIVYINSN